MFRDGFDTELEKNSTSVDGAFALGGRCANLYTGSIELLNVHDGSLQGLE
jgi:hypothetical protein